MSLLTLSLPVRAGSAVEARQRDILVRLPQGTISFSSPKGVPPPPLGPLHSAGQCLVVTPLSGSQVWQREPGRYLHSVPRIEMCGSMSPLPHTHKSVHGMHNHNLYVTCNHVVWRPVLTNICGDYSVQ